MTESEHGPLSSDLAIFLIQVIVILTTARFLGLLLGRIRQPMVIAEIISGIVLGPSLMGRVPGFSDKIFPPHSLPLLGIFAQVGLLFFMFLIGLELDPKVFAKNLKPSLIISLSSIALPFTLGAFLSLFMHRLYEIEAPFSSFVLFVGVSMSITAFPVLARILAESGLISMKVGILTLSAAAANDMVGWIILAFCVSIVTATSSLGALWTTLETLGFLLAMGLVGGRILQRIADRYLTSRGIPQIVVVGTFLLLCFSSLATEAIGIHALFGAFVLGSVFPKKDMHLAEKFVQKIEDMVVCFLLPLYFVYSGLRTDLGLLNNGQAWLMALLVILVACTGKIVGGGAAAKVLGLNWRESLTLGVLMNTRGLVELIVLNIGLDLGVLTPTIFAAMVVMALSTTFMTAPLVRLIYSPEKIAAMLRQKSLLTQAVDFSLVVCVNTSHSAPAHQSHSSTGLLTLAKAVVTYYKQESLVTVLQLVEPSDRPSTYMRELNPEEDKESLAFAVASKARDMGIPKVEIESTVSTNFAEDLNNCAKIRHANLVILNWNKPVVGEFTSLGDEVIYDFVNEAPCSVGILIDQGIGNSFTKVLLPYTGSVEQLLGSSALKLARLLAKYKGCEVVVQKISAPQVNISSATASPGHREQVQLDDELDAPILAPSDKYVDEEAVVKKKGSKKFRFLAMDNVSDPVEVIMEEARNDNYNLVIFGFHQEDIIQPKINTTIDMPLISFDIINTTIEKSTKILETTLDKTLGLELNVKRLIVSTASGFDVDAILKQASTSVLFVKHFEEKEMDEVKLDVEDEHNNNHHGPAKPTPKEPAKTTPKIETHEVTPKTDLL